MEKFSLGDIEVRLKKIRGRTLSYRILIIENAVNINVPARARRANVIEKAEEIVREGKKKGKFNELKDGGKIRLFGKDVPVCAAEAKKSSVGHDFRDRGTCDSGLILCFHAWELFCCKERFQSPFLSDGGGQLP